MNVENIISCYREEIILMSEKIEDEMNDIKNDSKSDDIANENPDYQELDGLYDSLDDIKNQYGKSIVRLKRSETTSDHCSFSSSCSSL